MVVMLLTPFKTILTGVTLGDGLVLLTAIVISRVLVDFGHNSVISAIVSGRNHAFALEEAAVNSLCGFTRLGVPAIIGIHLAAGEFTREADAMFTTIMLSMVFIVLGVMMIRHVETKHRNRAGQGDWPPLGREDSELPG